MADRARDPDGRQVQAVLGIVEEALHADDGVGLQQLEGRLLLVQADGAVAQDLPQHVGDGVEIHLQAQGEGLMRRQPRPDAVALGSGDGLVQAQLPAPEVLAAERVVPEGLPAFVDHPVGVGLDVGPARDLLDGGIARRRLFRLQVPACGQQGADGQRRSEQPFHSIPSSEGRGSPGGAPDSIVVAAAADVKNAAENETDWACGRQLLPFDAVATCRAGSSSARPSVARRSWR
jgi:hypothetical protein